MKKILLVFLAALCGLVAPAQKYQENGTPMDFKNGLRVGKNLRVPSDTLASADSNSIAAKSGTIFIKDGSGYWRKIIGSSTDSFDTTYQLIFSSLVFDHYLVYAYTDSSTGYHYYNDSIALKGQSDIADNKFLGQKDGAVGFHPMYLQTVLDAGGGINRRNWLNFNGYKFNWDSIGGFHLAVKAFMDTAFSIIRGGGLNLLTVRNSDGYTVVHNFTTNSGNVNINNATGMTISNSYLRMGSGSRIVSENGPLVIERSRIPGSGGGLQGLIITNDTLGLPGTADSSTLSLLEIQFRNYNNNLRDPKVKIFADGSIWIPYTPYISAASVDSLLAIKNGKLVKVLKSDIGGGGGGAVNSVFGRTGDVVAASGDYTWAQINKTSSSLADIATRNWSDLQNKPTTLATIGITDAQPLDGDLTSISAISSNGIPKRTGANTWSIATAGTDYALPLTTPDNMVSVTPSTSAISLKNTFNALTSGTSITVDLSLGPNYSLSLAHNAAITFTNAQAGNWFQIWVTQTAGGNTLTIAGQPVSINSTASSLSWVSGVYNGSAWVIGKNVADPVNLASSSAITGVLPYTNGGIGLSSLGTANQMLRVNSGGTSLEYFTPSYLTGNQSISFTPNAGGDITGSASGTTSLTPNLTIGNDKVTYAKMQNVSNTNRIMGRITAGAGDMEELTSTQATSLLDVFTSLLKGLVPPSGGGTTNFLRADGSFANPHSGDEVGIYTPTLTWVNGGNSATAAGFKYSASGDAVKIVKISGRVNVNSATDATDNLWQLRVSLPSGLTETFGTVNSVTGIVSVSLTDGSYVPAVNAGALTAGFCTADITNNEILLNFKEPTNDGFFSVWVECTYVITND
jgi:hypothetical protein